MISRLGSYAYVKTLVLLLCSCALYAQDCNLPILSSFQNNTTSSFTLDWFDFNDGDVSWEIEFGEQGFARSGFPTIRDIAETTIDLTGLLSGVTYEIYIRAVCSNEEFSDWNGPFFTNTVIENSGLCQLNLEIPDNNCPLESSFLIEVDNHPNSTLGIDLTLDHLNLIIQHPWPPDLRVSLVAPNGVAVLLTEFNGTGADDYGFYDEDDCGNPIVFTDNACESIDVAMPPFVGAFQPESTLSDILEGSPINGTWELRICDRAAGDLGVLQNVELVFSDMACVAPPSFTITDIEADNITVAWNDSPNCMAIEINFKKAADPIQLSSAEYIECDRSPFRLTDLEPDTEYEMTVRSDCGFGIFSPASCTMTFITSCENNSLRAEFDSQNICVNDCEAICLINEIWKNDIANKTNWLVNSAQTSTTFTGPDSDRKGTGNYLYIESQDQCETETAVTLISSCLQKPDDSPCALSFFYHMYGLDIGTLEIAYSLDSVSWTSLWKLEGEQGDAWNLAVVELPFAFDKGLIRFQGTRQNSGVRGDMAIDNIKLIGMDEVEPRLVYVDADGDGFGDLEKPVLLCSTEILLGYSMNSNDCDDNNAAINPAAVELNCNMIDDNCNGMQDDAGNSDISYIVGSVLDETCLGAENGLINIQAVNGQAPFQYEWSNGESGQAITDLTTGIYFCTITDFGGCQLVTDPIFVDFDDLVVYSIKDVLASPCKGNRSGTIELRIEGGLPPYQINWSNGRRGSVVTNLEDGSYSATITDATSCSTIIDSVMVTSPQVLTTGIVQQRDNDCIGGNSGFIQLGILGGSPPYNISWSNGSNSNVNNNLEAGTYSATVTDQNDCLSILSDIAIIDPEELDIELTAIEHITCNGGTNSFVDITVRGGTAPYSYFWSDGTNKQDIVNREAGLYHVTVSDVKSCSAVLENIEILEPSPLNVRIDSLVNVSCAGSESGFVEIEATGGTGPYEYNWGIFDGNQLSENFLDSLLPGAYSLTVVDNFECKSRAFSLDIQSMNTPLRLDIERTTDIRCFGDSTGVLTVQINDGLAPYDFNWSSGDKNISISPNDSISGLIAGLYNVTVTDTEGCVGISDSISISDLAALAYEVEMRVDNACWNENQGAIEINILGGTPPYDVNWSHTTANLTSLFNLASGNYAATITDNEGCTKTTTNIEIMSPAAITVDVELQQPTDTSLGSITVNPSGGTGQLSILWRDPLDGMSSETVMDLGPGDYPLSIVDALGCVLDTIITLDLISSVENPTDSKQVFIYPNPTNDKIILSEEVNGLQYIRLYNLNGQEVMHLNSNYYSMNKEILLPNLPSGLYYYQIKTTTASYLGKIIIVD